MSETLRARNDYTFKEAQPTHVPTNIHGAETGSEGQEGGGVQAEGFAGEAKGPMRWWADARRAERAWWKARVGDWVGGGECTTRVGNADG